MKNIIYFPMGFVQIRVSPILRLTVTEYKHSKHDNPPSDVFIRTDCQTLSPLKCYELLHVLNVSDIS